MPVSYFYFRGKIQTARMSFCTHFWELMTSGFTSGKWSVPEITVSVLTTKIYI